MKTKVAGIITLAIIGLGTSTGSASASVAENTAAGDAVNSIAAGDDTGWVAPADTGW